ncbi:MAG: serpin family protein [Polyangiaceae bacterium]
MRQTLSRWSAVVAAALLAGCSGTLVPDETTGGAPTSSTKVRTGAPIVDSKAEVPPATAAERSLFAQASNAFSADLYRELSVTPGNLFYSPASLSTALAMTWIGARGATRDQMTSVLHFGDVKGADANALTSSAARLIVAMNDPARTDYTLSIVNRLFGEQTYGFDAGFLDVTKKQFGAELAAVDFKHAFEPVRGQINDYVATSTHDKIKNLIPSGAIDEDVRLVLVNAIYMHADWATPFDKAATTKQPFHLTPTSSVDVDTMHGEVYAPMGEVDGVQMIDLPYRGGDLSMTILLPKDASRMGELEAKITGGGLDAMVAGLQATKVDLALPKFKIDPQAPLGLAGTLSKLGMPLAFSEGAADFSGMRKPGEEALFISKVFHKAFVAVDELGTEAAAASAIVMSRETADVPSNTVFVADHPFLFVLRDKKSGLVLFMGRLADPS